MNCIFEITLKPMEAKNATCPFISNLQNNKKFKQLKYKILVGQFSAIWLLYFDSILLLLKLVRKMFNLLINQCPRTYDYYYTSDTYIHIDI